MRRHPRPAIRTVLIAGLATLAVAAAAIVGPASGADAYAGAPWFRPSVPYTGNFPDPAVLVVGGTAYAYATNTGGAYLPVMSSSDLSTWTPRPAYSFPGMGDPFFNDATPLGTPWGFEASPSNPRLKQEFNAPGVERIGGRYVVYQSVRVSPTRMCITVFVGDDQQGPFLDTSTGPLVCDADPGGSIDPDPFIDTDGTPYLTWKSEGVPGTTPTRIWSRRLSSDGLSFAPGTTPSVLAQTSAAWEGNVIENPSMVRWNGALYLFFSGNEWRSASYAMGYAVCSGPTGPCTKSASNPIMRSRDDMGRLGPGGADAFVWTDGSLRLAYHWWNAPFADYPAHPACVSAGTCTSQGQRRLGIERVSSSLGGLVVGDGGWGATPAAPGGRGGYWLLGADGAVTGFGGAPTTRVAGLQAAAVDIEPTPSGDGAWVLAADGTVGLIGDATPFARPPVALQPGERFTSLSATGAGAGLWLATDRGRVVPLGNAPALGDMSGRALNDPVLDMVATASGNGYYLTASDGGIFAFGDAVFHGSMGGQPLNEPVRSLVPDPDGTGYWLVAADGGVFAFDAAFRGSVPGVLTPGQRLNAAVRAMTPYGNGYLMVASDGGVFTFSDRPFAGSLADRPLSAPIVAIATRPV